MNKHEIRAIADDVKSRLHNASNEKQIKEFLTRLNNIGRGC
jgi:hypothetical protein